MTYQVGRAEHPHNTDPHFDTEVEALVAARQAANGDQVYAVWQWANDVDVDTIYLVYQGDVWKRT